MQGCRTVAYLQCDSLGTMLALVSSGQRVQMFIWSRDAQGKDTRRTERNRETAHEKVNDSESIRKYDPCMLPSFVKLFRKSIQGKNEKKKDLVNHNYDITYNYDTDMLYLWHKKSQ